MDRTRLLERGLLGWTAVGAAALSLLSGCGPMDVEYVDGGEEEVEETAERLTTFNGLSQNGISQNGLSQNGLSQNGISQNGISQNGISQNGLSQNGLGLQVIKYMLRCALPVGACVDFSTAVNDADLPEECSGGACHFCGMVGLAPDWLNGPLSLSDERWVSACVLAHVNLDETAVTISVRDAVPAKLDPVVAPESKQFKASEAAFYGNIFRPGPSGKYEKYVCNAGANNNVPPGRVCGKNAASAAQCEMTFMGSCLGASVNDGDDDEDDLPQIGNGACNFIDSRPNSAVGGCLDTYGTRWSAVITVFDMRHCGNGVCSGSETAAICPQDCATNNN